MGVYTEPLKYEENVRMLILVIYSKNIILPILTL